MNRKGLLQTNSQLAELINEPLLAWWSGAKAHIKAGEAQAVAACEQLHVMHRDPMDGVRIAHERAIEAGGCGVDHEGGLASQPGEPTDQ